MKLVFATNNKHKLEEVKTIISNDFEILNLKDINCVEDIPETQDTIEGNASQKAFYIYENYKTNCFADDTGLEIDVLNGEPGVYSARYAGEGCSFDDNIEKVLKKLTGVSNRKAQFKTVISLVIDGKEYQFKGIIEGTLLKERRGTSGFGYDPVFLPKGYNKTFAELSSEEKNKISHRGRASRKLAEFLKNR
ncbi:MAG: non-canonical purine NTP diphosphatase [Bacteroidales bacterium]|nr:non-canonical purine NTP diphosphatase [Bacteroidales bacterium]